MIYEKSVAPHPIEQFKPERRGHNPVFRIKSTPWHPHTSLRLRLARHGRRGKLAGL